MSWFDIGSRWILPFILVVCGCLPNDAQCQIYEGKTLTTDSTTYANVYVKTIHSDSLSSTYAIWVKQGVRSHMHERHTEVITVLQGKAEMVVGDEKQTIKKGDVVIIPMGTAHSVVTTSRKPLLVISIQAPQFLGKDRIWIKDNNE